MYTDLALHIGGNWISGGSRQGEDVVNPATGKTLGGCRTRARATSTRRWRQRLKAFEVWRATNAYERAKVLRKAASLVRERADEHSPGS